MSMFAVIQAVVIGVVVTFSAWQAFRKLAPKTTNRWLAAASIHFNQPQRSALSRVFGRRLQPKQATGNCSDGCSTCGACGSKPPAAARTDAMPLEFRPRH